MWAPLSIISVQELSVFLFFPQIKESVWLGCGLLFFLLENKKGDRLLAAYSIYHKNILLCSRGYAGNNIFALEKGI
jgi:hypothetical protein